ncbi:hypothetical protein Tco_0223251 [Tanacetum coccineum]
MAKSSNPTQIPSPPKVIPKEEPVTLDRPMCLWNLKLLKPPHKLIRRFPKAICNIDVPGARSGLRRKQSSKHTSKSKTKASKSKTGQSDKETQSSLAKDKSSSHPSASTPMVAEMYKEAQQAAGGPTSLRATSEEGAHPQLSSGTNPSVLVDKSKSAKDGLKTAHTDLGTDEESRSDETLKKIKLEDLLNLMQDTRSAFFSPNSLVDEPIIVSYKSEEEETQ